MAMRCRGIGFASMATRRKAIESHEEEDSTRVVGSKVTSEAAGYRIDGRWS
jgi:hypothetical protein